MSALKRGWLAAALLIGPALAAPLARAETSLALIGGLRGDFTRHMTWAFDQKLKFAGLKKIDTYAPDISMSYQPWKFVEIDAGYRIIYTRDHEDVFRYRFRLYGSANLKWNPGTKWQLRYRVRWLEETRDRFDDSFEVRNTLRQRALVRYQINKKVQPFAAAELYKRLDRGLVKFADRTRYTLGLDMDAGKRRQATMFLRQTVPGRSGTRSTLIGFGYQYTLK